MILKRVLLQDRPDHHGTTMKGSSQNTSCIHDQNIFLFCDSHFGIASFTHHENIKDKSVNGCNRVINSETD